jgi:hypothetical protein
MTWSIREQGTSFADVVYADQQWVDAEFAELISASFSEPPVQPPPAPPRVPPPPGYSPPSIPGPVPVLAARAIPAPGPAWCRQRSPPAHERCRPARRVACP